MLVSLASSSLNVKGTEKERQYPPMAHMKKEVANPEIEMRMREL